MDFAHIEDYLLLFHLKKDNVIDSDAKAEDFEAVPQFAKAALQNLYDRNSSNEESNKTLKLQLRDIMLENRKLVIQNEKAQTIMANLRCRLQKLKVEEDSLKSQKSQLQKQLDTNIHDIKHLELALEARKRANGRELLRLRSQTERLESLRLAQMPPKVQNFYISHVLAPSTNLKPVGQVVSTQNQAIIVAWREKLRTMAQRVETCLLSLGETPVLSIDPDDQANPVVLANEIVTLESLLDHLMETANAFALRSLTVAEDSSEVQHLHQKLEKLLELYHKTLRLVEDQQLNTSIKGQVTTTPDCSVSDQDGNEVSISSDYAQIQVGSL